jgi:hypothetical protein
MFLKRIIIATAALLYGGGAVVAQDDGYRNEIGIDVANIITFLSKKSESYLINYKRHFTGDHGLRSGLNLDWSTSDDGYKTVGIKAGYERGYPVVSEHWKLHWGADASFRYQSNNFQPNKSVRYGLTPLIGFSYFPVRRFSISTEMGVNFLYTDYRNAASFYPAANAGVWDINIASVGMLVIYYHF